MIKTAGKILSEEEIRTYSLCSRRYHFGEGFTVETNVQILDDVYKRMMAEMMLGIREVGEDYVSLSMEKIDRILVREALADKSLKHLLDAQRDAAIRKLRIQMGGVVRQLPLKNYIMVSGPVKYNVRISKTLVGIEVPCVLRSRFKKDKNIHSIQISPYADKHGAINDPVAQIKLHSLSKLAYAGESATLHIFYDVNDSTLGYTSIQTGKLKSAYPSDIKNLILSMEAGIHYPSLPCRFSCKFKQICIPGEV